MYPICEDLLKQKIVLDRYVVDSMLNKTTRCVENRRTTKTGGITMASIPTHVCQCVHDGGGGGGGGGGRSQREKTRVKIQFTNTDVCNIVQARRK